MGKLYNGAQDTKLSLEEENQRLRAEVEELLGAHTFATHEGTPELGTHEDTPDDNSALGAQICPDTTTLIVRLSRRNTGTPEMLMSDLDLLGFAQQYDYIFVPRSRKSTKGYAFVNMTDSAHAHRLGDCIQVLKDPRMENLELQWLDKASSSQAARIQGRDECQEPLAEFLFPMTSLEMSLQRVHLSNTKTSFKQRKRCSFDDSETITRVQHFFQSSFVTKMIQGVESRHLTSQSLERISLRSACEVRTFLHCWILKCSRWFFSVLFFFDE